jgi:hypothetical protein
MKMLMKPKQLRPLPATESEPHPREFVIDSDKDVGIAERKFRAQDTGQHQYPGARTNEPEFLK